MAMAIIWWNKDMRALKAGVKELETENT